MAAYAVFSHCVTYTYKSTYCSKSSVFLFTSTFLTIFLPLLIAYRSHGFWLKSSTYREQPLVHFTNKYLLLLETNQPDKPIMCSSYVNFNEMIKDFNHCSLVKTREEDDNQDGKPDELYLEIRVIPPMGITIFTVELILFFDYELLAQCLLNMETLTFIQYQSCVPGSKLDIMGDLHLVQKQPVRSHGRDVRFAKPIIDSNSYSPDTYQTINILKDFARRNVSTILDNKYMIWSRGPPQDDTFIISATIYYPEDTITYRPGFWQVMKWAWMQYITILIIFIVLFRYIKLYVFKNRLLPSVKEIPWKKLY